MKNRTEKSLLDGVVEILNYFGPSTVVEILHHHEHGTYPETREVILRETVVDSYLPDGTPLRVLRDRSVCPECPQAGANFPIQLDFDEHGASCPNCGRWWKDRRP